MKKTIKKRAFISAIAMLIVSAIVLTSSTFAWFSMAKTGTVEMDLTIASPDGIQISANTSAFTTALTMADFKGTSGSRYAAYSGNINNFPENLSPVSSILRCNPGLPTFYSGAIDDQGKCTVTTVPNDVGSNFVVFDLFIQLASATNVSFANSKIECVEPDLANPGKTKVAENQETVMAMRMATINCGLVEKNAVASDIKAKVPTGQNLNGANVAQMLEPKPDQHTSIAKDKGASGTIITNYMMGTADKVYCDSTYNNIIPSTSTVVTGTNADATCSIPAQAGINRIRVYIWMEGQDVDCANDVAGSALKVTLNFDI